MCDRHLLGNTVTTFVSHIYRAIPTTNIFMFLTSDCPWQAGRQRFSEPSDLGAITQPSLIPHSHVLRCTPGLNSRSSSWPLDHHEPSWTKNEISDIGLCISWGGGGGQSFGSQVSFFFYHTLTSRLPHSLSLSSHVALMDSDGIKIFEAIVLPTAPVTHNRGASDTIIHHYWQTSEQPLGITSFVLAAQYHSYGLWKSIRVRQCPLNMLEGLLPTSLGTR